MFGLFSYISALPSNTLLFIARIINSDALLLQAKIVAKSFMPSLLDECGEL